MATLGADLQHARELAGLSIEDLSARTKIRRHMLEAIERNDFASIPGGLLARGYLRAYASEVSLPPEGIAARYQTEFGGEAPALAEAFKHRTDAWDLARPDHSNATVMTLALIAIVGAWLYVSQRPPSERRATAGRHGRPSRGFRCADRRGSRAAPRGSRRRHRRSEWVDVRCFAEGRDHSHPCGVGRSHCGRQAHPLRARAARPAARDRGPSGVPAACRRCRRVPLHGSTAFRAAKSAGPAKCAKCESRGRTT